MKYIDVHYCILVKTLQVCNTTSLMPAMHAQRVMVFGLCVRVCVSVTLFLKSKVFPYLPFYVHVISVAFFSFQRKTLVFNFTVQHILYAYTEFDDIIMMKQVTNVCMTQHYITETHTQYTTFPLS